MKKGSIFLSSIMLVLMFMLSSLTSFAAGINTWTTKAPMLTARQNHQAAVVGGKIYAIGGYDGTGYLNSVEEYDPQTDTWTNKAPMTTARAYHQVAVVDEKIYAIGGYNSTGYLNTVEEYDPATNTWTSKSSMVDARQYHQVAVVAGKIYAVGGYNSISGYLSSVEEYDPKSNIWSQKASMSKARQNHQLAILEDKIYAIGGFNSTKTLNSVEEYDPSRNIWTTKASLSTVRQNHQVAVVCKKIYAIGGADGTFPIDYNVEEYDPVTNKWTGKASLNNKRQNFQAVVIGEKIFVTGGRFGSDGSLNTIEAYCPESGTWVTRASMSTSRVSHKIAEIGGKIYAIGGFSGNATLNAVEEYSTEYSSLPPPANLTAKVNNTEVNLSWAEVNGATDYAIKRSRTAGGPYTTIAINSLPSYTDANISNGGAYYYVVCARNADGESLNSSEVSVILPVNTAAVVLDVTSIDKAKLGDEITANIVIHNATNICAEDIKIAYDTSKLEFIGNENVEGIKIYNQDNTTGGAIRYITASLGKANAANGDKVLIKLKFKAIDIGEAKIDITNSRIADNATLEMDIAQENCGEKTVLIVGGKDVNRTGEYTLLDLGIDAWYYGDAVANTDTDKYDADQVVNGTIDDDDLSEIVAQILGNTNYTANN